MSDYPLISAPPADVLRVAGVSVSLSGRQVLDDVSFAVGPGEFTGLIGPNGAGKTTLIRVILGLQRTTAGTVELAEQPHPRRSRSVGYVPQKLLPPPCRRSRRGPERTPQSLGCGRA
jgi:zinc/manganese transport system ATP-binding protein